MDDIERIFIKEFIKNKAQERLTYEFASRKKRSIALSRFAHNAEEILNGARIYKKWASVTAPEILNEVEKLCKRDKAYVISMGADDACFLNCEDAVLRCLDDYMPQIVIFDEKTALLKTETEGGCSLKFILKV